MRHRTRLWISMLAATLALGLAPAAHAVLVLATPPLGTPGGQLTRCRIVNLGTRAIRVGIELWTTDGDLVFHEDFVVQPRSIGTAGWLANPALNGYCRFLGSFSPATVRASIESYRPSGMTTSVVVAPAD
jgi:hypothetical protein